MMAHATHTRCSTESLSFFLSLTAAAVDDVVVVTDVVSCLLLSINAGRRLLLLLVVLWRWLFLDLPNLSRVGVPQECIDVVNAC